MVIHVYVLPNAESPPSPPKSRFERTDDVARQGSDAQQRNNGPSVKRGEARVKARAYFAKFPKAAYMTEIESWRELSGGRIEFTIRRLPSAD
jgi:hypothetical protein